MTGTCNRGLFPLLVYASAIRITEIEELATKLRSASYARHAKLRSASYARQADSHGLTPVPSPGATGHRLFVRRTSPSKNSHRFAGKRQKSEVSRLRTRRAPAATVRKHGERALSRQEATSCQGGRRSEDRRETQYSARIIGGEVAD